MRVQSIAAKRKDELPDHELAAGHHLLLAMRERGGKPRLRDAREIRASGVVACERIRELIYDIAKLDMYNETSDQFSFGWIAHAQRALGLSYATTWGIARGEILSVSTHTVDRISQVSGVPVSVIYAQQS